MALAATRLLEISGLLDVMDVHVSVVSRRLIKSGPGHYARARFDALDYIARTQFIDLEPVAQDAPLSLCNQFHSRFRVINDALETMAVDYEEFDPVRFLRNDKNRYRSERLIDEIIESTGLRRRGVDLDASIYEGRAAARIRLAENVADEDAPIALHGTFRSKRTGE